ncbi:MAG: helix-turn-helix domain-containing protein [Sulfurovum sp.]|nr:helix-turn-helix domain-containing protein [Sulfurovum sp.]
MQQRLFPNAVGQEECNQINIGAGLKLRIFEEPSPYAKLYVSNVLIKTCDFSDKTEKRLFIVEAVELGATKATLAKALNISRQTIHNYIEVKRNFGSEGLIHSYHSTNSKNLEAQRKLNKDKLAKGNKARQLEEIRKKAREEKGKDVRQLSFFSGDFAGENQAISSDEQPFSEVHGWEASRYAGIFLYFICLISESRWLEFVAAHFGNYYKIFMVFVLMVGRNIPSIEQLKNINCRESGVILGLKKLPSKFKIWEWFYNAANLNKSCFLLYDYFRYQIGAGIVGTWLWFIDGHLLPYTGKDRVHCSYNTQRRMPMPGRTNLVTCDINGRIVDFKIQEGKGDLRKYVVTLKERWSKESRCKPIMVFDREGYGGDFFYGLIKNDIPFVTWDKYVDTAKLAKLDSELFCGEITVNGKKYGLFEGEKEFSYTAETGDNKNGGQSVKFNVRRIYIWNKSCNRRTCGLAWTSDINASTAECARAILNRWGASENTFKHLNDRHPFHYHPGFRLEESKKQEISNPEIKKKQGIIKKLATSLNQAFKKIAKAKDVFNKDGTLRQNSVKERLKTKIVVLESEIETAKKEKNELPEKVDVSKLEDYKSFKWIDNEGKNLFDFVTSSVWNARKQMVDWLGLYFDQKNEVVDLFYAITNCHGWIKSSKTEVIVRLEPIQQPKRRAAQEQLCRKLTSLCARLPAGKWLIIEVGDCPY